MPFEYGEGSKLKFLEACGRGVPVLSTTAGLCGISISSPLVTVSDTPDAWVQRIQCRGDPDARDLGRLLDYAGEHSWSKLSRKFLAFVEDAFLKTSS
jgi:hypothetical protein